MGDRKQFLKNHIKRQVKKKLIAFLGKKLIAGLAAIGGPVLLIILLAVILLFIVYSIMPGNGLLSGTEASEADKVIQEQAQTLTSKWNVADMYEVPGEASDGLPWYGRGGKKISERQDEYGGRIFIDNNGRDAELANRWGDAYSTVLFDMIRKGESEYPIDQLEPVVKDLHPYFYYKKSTIEVCTPNAEGEMSCHTEDIYLLVEAKTIRGWYQYDYEWYTEHFDGGGHKKYERLKNNRTLERWEFLEEYLAKKYEVPEKDREFTLQAVVNASDGFTQQKEWMEWLFNNVSGFKWVSQSMITSEMKLMFEDAGKKYGIPWWFLAAVALKESSFNPMAERDDNGCFGLMQVTPDNWKHYAPALGFDVVADKYNPRAQVMVGAHMLSAMGLKSVNWSANGWKKETLDELAYYGGFRGPDALTRAELQYASVIWSYADRLKTERIGWPVQGTITAYFGEDRGDHSHGGIDIGAPAGMPVVSVSGGVVEVAKYDDVAGNYIVVKDLLYSYSYMHLSRMYVEPGYKITPGTAIGAVGSTGRSTGPHLHFQIRDLTTNSLINPMTFLGD